MLECFDFLHELLELLFFALKQGIRIFTVGVVTAGFGFRILLNTPCATTGHLGCRGCFICTGLELYMSGFELVEHRVQLLYVSFHFLLLAIYLLYYQANRLLLRLHLDLHRISNCY